MYHHHLSHSHPSIYYPLSFLPPASRFQASYCCCNHEQPLQPAFVRAERALPIPIPIPAAVIPTAAASTHNLGLHVRRASQSSSSSSSSDCAELGTMSATSTNSETEPDSKDESDCSSETESECMDEDVDVDVAVDVLSSPCPSPPLCLSSSSSSSSIAPSRRYQMSRLHRCPSRVPVAILFNTTELQYTVKSADLKQYSQEQRVSSVVVPIRVMFDGSEHWFVAKDVCALIGKRGGSVGRAVDDFAEEEKARMVVAVNTTDKQSVSLFCSSVKRSAVQVLSVLSMRGIDHLFTRTRSVRAEELKLWFRGQTDKLTRQQQQPASTATTGNTHQTEDERRANKKQRNTDKIKQQTTPTNIEQKLKEPSAVVVAHPTSAFSVPSFIDRSSTVCAMTTRMIPREHYHPIHFRPIILFHSPANNTSHNIVCTQALRTAPVAAITACTSG